MLRPSVCSAQGLSPRKYLTSLPQMPQAFISTRTEGPGMRGIGTVIGSRHPARL